MAALGAPFPKNNGISWCVTCHPNDPCHPNDEGDNMPP